MNEYDGYVEDYLIRFFKNMPSTLIPRDRTLENQIILACKVEYSIRFSPEETITQILGSTTLSIKGADGKIWNIIARKNCDGYFELHGADNNSVSSFLCGEWNEFGYNLRNFFPRLGLHFIEAYRIIKNTDRYSAIAELAKQFNLKAETPISCRTKRFRFLKNHLLGLRISKLYGFYIEGDDTLSHLLFVRYFDNKKIVLPLHWLEGLGIPWHFFPDERSPFFNQAYLFGGHVPIVVLTDSIELAGINQEILDRAQNPDIAWISWYGERNAVEKMDWTLLKGCRVYYLLLAHSGFGGKTVYETALAVKRKLDEVGVAEFKFISCLAAGINNAEQSKVDAPIPTIYNADEFEPAMARERQTLPPTFAAFQNDLARLTRGRKVLLAPLIRERSATLIWGMPKSGKTWFAAHMAMAMALGKPGFQNWSPLAHRSTILYIHGESEGDVSLEEKLTVLAKIFSSHATIAINPNAFLSGITMQPVVYCNDQPINFTVQLLDKRCTPPALDLYSAILHLSQTIEKSAPPGVIILDDVFFSSPQTWTLQNMLIRDLKSAGWAIIIVAGPQLAPAETGIIALLNSLADVHKSTPEFIDRAQVDSIIRIKKRSCKDGKLMIGVKIESPWVNAVNSKFDCYLDSIANPPSFEKVKRDEPRWSAPLKKSRVELVREVTELHQKGFKGQQVADKLGITLSMVKKIKREWGLSKPRGVK